MLFTIAHEIKNIKILFIGLFVYCNSLCVVIVSSMYVNIELAKLTHF